MSETIIRLENVVKGYSRGGETLEVLDGLDLNMEQGHFYALMGPSGSGKTTLLNLSGGLDQPDEGLVEVAGEDLGALRGSELARWRADHVGFIFQGFNLIPDLNLFDNVDVPLRYRGMPAPERKKVIQEMLEMVGLGSRMSYLPSQLSGGQQQRVAIARALAGKPRFLLADEPTGNLDTAMAHQVLDLLEQIHADGTTIVMVTHDPDLANRAERNIHLIDGRVAAEELVFTPRESIASMQADTGEQLAAQS